MNHKEKLIIIQSLDMYRSKKSIEHLPKGTLIKNFKKFLRVHPKIYCSHIGRPVFFNKQPDAILKRRDVKKRLECFLSGVDILRHSKKWESKIIDGSYCIEVVGIAKSGEKVFIHLREEVKDGDKKLYLISTFY